jgi:hypothetical protein
LWLKNCRTRSPTPEKESPPQNQQQQTHAEQSPSPMSLMSAVMDDKVMKRLQIKQPPPSSSSMSAAKITSSVVNLTHSTSANNNNDNSREGTKMPLINVLPSSKLLSRNILHHKNLRKRRVSARLALSSSTNGRKVNQNVNAGIASSERVMNTNFPADLRAKIHTQMSSSSSNGSKGGIQSSSFNRPPLQHPPTLSPMQQPNVPLHQFMQRPPINLFKFRMPFSMSPHHRPMMPPEDSNLNLLQPTTNSLLPPPVVIVPYPICLPIILPIPLPLTAFMRAYQTKGSSETSMKANDNESREKSATTTAAPNTAVKKDMRSSEAEQPLDLSSEQGVCCVIDKDFVTPIQLYHNNNNNHHSKNNNNKNEAASTDNDEEENDADEENDDDDDLDDGRIKSEKVRLILSNKNGAASETTTTPDKIPKFEISRVGNHRQHHAHVKEDTSSCESNRPLRKRKIIATEEVSESQ